MYKININDNKFDFCEVLNRKDAQNTVEFLTRARKILYHDMQPLLPDFSSSSEEYQKILKAVKVIREENSKPFRIFRRFQHVNRIFKKIFSFFNSSKRIEKLCLHIEALGRSYERNLNLNAIPINEQYEELIRRLPSIEKGKIENFQLNQDFSNSLFDKIDRGDWQGIRTIAAENLQEKGMQKLTFHALALIKENKMSINQFSTLMFFLTACKQHGPENVKIIPLFKENSVNPAADELIRTTMKDGEDYFDPFKFIAGKRANHDELEIIYALIEKAPKSEHFLFMMPDSSGHYASNNKRYNEATITQRIQVELGINQFGRIKHKIHGKHQRLISTISSVQALLDTTTPFQFQINPVLAVSSVADIQKNGKNNNRDVQLPYAAVQNGLIGSNADGFKIEDQYDMPEHDFYHCKICAYIPPEHKQAFNRVIELISNIALDKLEISKDILLQFKKEFRWKLTDMEFPKYKSYKNSLYIPFLFGYYLLKMSQHFESQLKPPQNSKEFSKVKEEIFKLFEFMTNELIMDMLNKPEEWKKFGISGEHMKISLRFFQKECPDTQLSKIFSVIFK
jgi:hypothetical protein